MMSCRQATELLSQALERRLTIGERLRLRVHLVVCVGCRVTGEQFRFLREAMRRHPWRR
jgi:hypothetical protein